MLLKGKVALITGASRGIGRAVAVRLAEEGADIAINFAGNEKAANEVKIMVEKMGRRAMLVQADVAQQEAVVDMVQSVIKEMGTIDILVNNAGIVRDGVLLRMKEENWDAVLDTNLKGVFHCTQAVTKLMMKKKQGRIINMTSVVGIMGNAGQANYAAAKAGVIGFSKAAAKELSSRGVTVNMVAPGCIDTDMTASLPDKAKDAMVAAIPLGRVGLPVDVANAVLFLASDYASYITGQVIHVDGGMVM